MSNLKKDDIKKARLALRKNLQKIYDDIYAVTEKADGYLKDLEELSKE